MVDPIDRQAAINALRKRMDKSAKGEIGSFYNQVIIRDIDLLESLPPVQPITAYVISDEDGNIKCSNCGSSECWGNYCMNCGAKMRGENNG